MACSTTFVALVAALAIKPVAVRIASLSSAAYMLNYVCLLGAFGAHAFVAEPRLLRPRSGELKIVLVPSPLKHIDLCGAFCVELIF